jgi:NAD(P)-dependent dehydrogenase (short-subunit alcohol dehydrogenase family)
VAGVVKCRHILPNGRWALTEEVALAILYLASDESSFITGTNLIFDNTVTE